MNIQLLLQGICELSLSMVTGLLVFYTSFKVFSLATKEIDEIKEIKNNNVACAILIVSFISGIMIILKISVDPAMDMLTTVFSRPGATFVHYLSALLRIFAAYCISAIVAFSILWIAMVLFMALTRDIDEMAEIKKNNSAVAIFLAPLIISIAVIVSGPLATILRGLVPAQVFNSKIHNPLINSSIVIEGLIELGISVVAVLFIFLLSFKVFTILTKDIDDIKALKQNNNAVAVLIASFVFAIMIMIRAAVVPANEALGYVIQENAGASVMIFTLLRIIAFFILAAIFSFIMIWIVIKVFMILTTRIDEMAEIKNNNVAVSLILAALILTTAFLLSNGLTLILTGLIKAPEVGSGLLDLSQFK